MLEPAAFLAFSGSKPAAIAAVDCRRDSDMFEREFGFGMVLVFINVSNRLGKKKKNQKERDR